RFLFMNVDRAEQAGVWSLKEFQKLPADAGIAGFQAQTLEDRWILSRFHAVAREVHEALAAFRFHEAANTVYDFFWGEFCDWYIEMVKLRLAAEGGGDREQVRAAFGNLLGLFEAALRLLSPFMPFLTEEIWHALYDGTPPLKSIALAAYPEGDAHAIDQVAETEMAVLRDLIVSVRNLRAELKVEPKARLPIRVHADAAVRKLLDANREAIEKLAGVEGVSFVEESLAKAAHARSTARFDVTVVYEKKIDAAAERERLQKELAKLEGELANAQKQLGNEQFLAKAPAKVVEGLRKRAAELELLIKKTRAALDELNNAAD
ncbi:MAG TPA: class I tRNA ligase family protein, partial [Terriglobales bacterium]|nr:class I tRNA ligase family protein [Terriglobales bacterium]